jgi:hypothetical protein
MNTPVGLGIGDKKGAMSVEAVWRPGFRRCLQSLRSLGMHLLALYLQGGVAREQNKARHATFEESAQPRQGG